jgi:hypothetical protein
MPAPTDAVMPILRRIQEDLAETRRELGRKIDSHSEKLDSIEGYLVYQLGLNSRDRADIQPLQAKTKAMEKRVTALERPPRGSGPKRKS